VFATAILARVVRRLSRKLPCSLGRGRTPHGDPPSVMASIGM
jgi:hypothetical protein